MSYLLDTCIISKLRKLHKQPDIRLEEWVNKHRESDYFISALTLGEIQSGINKLNINHVDEKKKRILLEDWFQEDLIPRFNHRILSIDTEVALTWGKLLGESKLKGITIPVVDGLIAATALVHNLTVVTDNLKDFFKTGARVFSPWLG